MIWSPYQEALFAHSGSNAFVNAVAGSGKTTAIVECINRVDFNESVLAVAFGTAIKKTLEGKVGHLPNVTVKTLNGLGYAACRQGVGRYIKIKEDKTETTMRFDVLGDWNEEKKSIYYACRYVIKKVVAIFKADMNWMPTVSDVDAVMDRFCLEIPPKIKYDQFMSLVLTTYAACMNKTLVMDFDDQIAMPLFKDWGIETFDRVFVDEAQDLTPAQIELTRRCLRHTRYSGPGDVVPPWSEVVYVGDPRQAIYQFRGADSHAVQNIIRMMDCVQLPLSICYRCSKAVVREAQKLVPHIEWHDDSPEGSVNLIPKSEWKNIVKAGDLILCRTTAPLVQAAFGFIREGRKATVRGREIEDSLLDVLDEISGGDRWMKTVDFAPLCGQFFSDKMERAAAKPDKLMQIQDLQETIECFFSCVTVNEMREMIKKVFKDDDSGILLMTGHKSKGLENPRVFIIEPQLLPHKFAVSDEMKLAEENLAYVMITRAQVDLFYVGSYFRLENRDVASSVAEVGGV